MNSTRLILTFGLSVISNVTVPRPAVFVNVQDIFHLRVRVAVFFVELLHLLRVGEQFLLVQRLADLDGDFLAEF